MTSGDVGDVGTSLEGPRFIFDHLPKTGGTALRVAFDRIFGTGEVSPPVLGRTERWAEKNLSRYRMIIGHFRSLVPLVGRSQSRVRMTVLRDPIDRAISEYFYYRNDAERLPWHKLAVYAKDHDFYAYLKILESEGDIAVSNRYAHHFAAQVSRGAWREGSLLASAKEAIAAYDLVGIQEQLSDFLDLFCGIYRLPAVPELPRANITSVRMPLRELDANTRDRLVRLNRVDLELYALARSRFQEAKRGIFRRFAARKDDQDHENRQALIAPEGVASSAAREARSFGDRAVQICEARVWSESLGRGKAHSGDGLTIGLTIESHIDVPDLTVGIEIVDDVGEVVFGTNTKMLGQMVSVLAGKRYDVCIAVKADIRHGRYFVTVGLHTGTTRADRCFDWREQLVFFDVVDGAGGALVGYCKLEAKADWREAPRERDHKAISLG